MRNTAPPTRRLRLSAPAFTLVELLVVVVIVGIIVGIAFPVTRGMLSYSSGEAGVNSVSVAVNAARIYAHRLKAPDMGEVGYPYPTGADYSGTAALFTPGGEIRLVINGIEAQRAAVNSNPAYPNDFLEESDDNAYTDIDTDYVQLPAASGIAGVYRSGPGDGGIQIIPPPFAIRFNQHGQLANDQDRIYYDSNRNGVYRLDYPSNYDDPDKHDPRLNSVNQVDGVYELPFEEIPTVSAVILFDANEFRNDGTVDWGSSGEDLRDWFKDDPNGAPRGTVIYFNPNSGAMLRGD